MSLSALSRTKVVSFSWSLTNVFSVYIHQVHSLVRSFWTCQDFINFRLKQQRTTQWTDFGNVQKLYRTTVIKMLEATGPTVSVSKENYYNREAWGWKHHVGGCSATRGTGELHRSVGIVKEKNYVAISKLHTNTQMYLSADNESVLHSDGTNMSQGQERTCLECRTQNWKKLRSYLWAKLKKKVDAERNTQSPSGLEFESNDFFQEEQSWIPAGKLMKATLTNNIKCVMIKKINNNK